MTTYTIEAPISAADCYLATAEGLALEKRTRGGSVFAVSERIDLPEGATLRVWRDLDDAWRYELQGAPWASWVALERDECVQLLDGYLR